MPPVAACSQCLFGVKLGSGEPFAESPLYPDDIVKPGRLVRFVPLSDLCSAEK
jgi:hypothetical protein